MRFMNRWDIDAAVDRHLSHPVLGPATRFLARFRDLIDDNSDGWAHWKAPVQASKRLFELIEDNKNPTEADLKKALVPIRSFCSKKQFLFPEV